MKQAPKTATELNLMVGSPPEKSDLVTLGNWFAGENIRWSFKNIPQLIPCAYAHRGYSGGYALQTAVSPLNINHIRYTNHRHDSLTIGEMLNQAYTDGFMILRHGKIIHETYLNMHPYQRHLLQSVSKSITACLVAIFVEKGDIDLKQTVSYYLPEFCDSAYGDATIQQLLDMTVSIQYDEDYQNMTSEVNLHTVASGWYGHIPRQGVYKNVPQSLYTYLPTLKEKQVHPHGDRFHYVSANTDVLGMILERVGKQPFMALFQEHIWQQLGAEENAAMTVDAWGCAFPCGGFVMTLRDLARFGLLVLGNGFFNGRQIVPKSFFSDTQINGDRSAWQKGEGLTDIFPSGSYRNHFWVTGNKHNAFWGWGIHGQYLYIDPVADVVIVQLSSHPMADDYDIAINTLLGFQAICDQLISWEMKGD